MKTFNIYIDSRQKWVRVAPQLDQNDVIWAYHALICKDLETDTFYRIDCYPIPESDTQDGKLTVADDVVFDRKQLRTLFQDYQPVVSTIEVNENVVEMLCDALNMTREEYEEGMFNNIPRIQSLPNLDPLNIQFIIVGYGEEDNSTDKNKVLRTIATGQSDITRHEAYTKATGLNEFNSLTPVYNSSANLEELMNQISEILSEYEISLSDLCVSSTWYNNKSCGILSITQNWTKIVSNELPPQVMIFSGEFIDDDKLNAKSFEGFDKVTSSSNQVSISKEDAIKLADLVIKACKQGYRLRVMVK